MRMNENELFGVIREYSKSYINSLINLFFPHCCIICGIPLMQSEDFLCMHCHATLPRTHFDSLIDNPVERMFYGKAKIEKASSFLYYQRGSEIKKIIYQLKYAGRKEIGEIIGKYMATEISSSGFFDDIDIIIPLPLHRNRLNKRGYNQSEWIAKGISTITHIPINNNIVMRVKDVDSQTHKTTFDRWKNVQQIFSLAQPELIKDMHILLVDDVLTTGATILSCATTIQKAENVKVSVLTLAVAAQ